MTCLYILGSEESYGWQPRKSKPLWLLFLSLLLLIKIIIIILLLILLLLLLVLCYLTYNFDKHSKAMVAKIPQICMTNLCFKNKVLIVVLFDIYIFLEYLSIYFLFTIFAHTQYLRIIKTSCLFPPTNMMVGSSLYDEIPSSGEDTKSNGDGTATADSGPRNRR